MVLKTYKKEQKKTTEEKAIEDNFEAHRKIFSYDYMSDKELNNKYRKNYLGIDWFLAQLMSYIIE